MAKYTAMTITSLEMVPHQCTSPAQNVAPFLPSMMDLRNTVTVLRVLRVLRVVKVLRVLRALRECSEC